MQESLQSWRAKVQPKCQSLASEFVMFFSLNYDLTEAERLLWRNLAQKLGAILHQNAQFSYLCFSSKNSTPRVSSRQKNRATSPPEFESTPCSTWGMEPGNTCPGHGGGGWQVIMPLRRGFVREGSVQESTGEIPFLPKLLLMSRTLLQIGM